MSGRKIFKVVLAVAAVGALSLQAVAFAAIPGGAGSSAKGGAVEAEEFKSSFKDLNYKKKKGVFSGMVKSTFGNDALDSVADDNVCTKGRKVTVIKNKNGNEVGSTHTNGKGEFSVDGPKKKNASKFSVKVAGYEFLYREYYGIEIFGKCLAASSNF